MLAKLEVTVEVSVEITDGVEIDEFVDRMEITASSHDGTINNIELQDYVILEQEEKDNGNN